MGLTITIGESYLWIEFKGEALVKQKKGGPTFSGFRSMRIFTSAGRTVLFFFLFLSLLWGGEALLSLKQGERIQGTEVKDRLVFTLAGKGEGIAFHVIHRISYDRGDCHRVYYKIGLPEGCCRRDIEAVSQWLVKQTLKQEDCRNIALDFGERGYVTFSLYEEHREKVDAKFGSPMEHSFRYIFF